MMSLFLGQFANSVHESQRGLEIGKLVGANNVMLIDDFPLRGIGQQAMNVGKILPF